MYVGLELGEARTNKTRTHYIKVEYSLSGGEYIGNSEIFVKCGRPHKLLSRNLTNRGQARGIKPVD